jgi:uridine kinase
MENVKEINNYILDWSKEKEKLVVAIDGYTGVGKTTITKDLEKNPDILVVHQDDFLLSRKEIETLLHNVEDKSVVFELYNRDIDKINKLVHAFKNNESSYSTKIFNPETGEADIEKIFDVSKKILVIEGVFMFHPKLHNALWDKRIYLEGDLSIIRERRIKREKERWKDKYFPEDHPDSHFRQVIIALDRYITQYNPSKLADVVIKID